MTIFQAYCFDKEREGDSFLLTFPNPYVADKWWRAISDTPAVASLFTRVNSQFYTYTASELSISDIFTDPRTENIVSDFQGQIYMKMIDDENGAFPIVQSSNIASAVSGTWVYIRSVATPHLYWYYNEQSAVSNSKFKFITVSETQRTRFRVTANYVGTGTVLTDIDFVTLEIEGTTRPMYVTAPGEVEVAKRIWEFHASTTDDFNYLGRIRNQAFVLPSGYLGYNASVSSESIAGAVWEFV